MMMPDGIDPDLMRDCVAKIVNRFVKEAETYEATEAESILAHDHVAERLRQAFPEVRFPPKHRRPT
ncbi:MAG: hypothetical protein GY769_20125 [bacterium]|nr:hypothetical protein [bacterium]